MKLTALTIGKVLSPSFLLAAGLVSGLLPTTASATAIPLGGGGVVSLSNLAGDLVAVSSVPQCIAFSNNTATCNSTTSDAVTGGDPIFDETTQGTIQDFNAAALPLASFETINLTIPGGPAIFDLLSVVAPSGLPACTFSTNSGSCTTGTFIITQIGTQVSITLALNLNGYLGTSGTGSTPYSGVFTTQLSGGLGQFGCAVSGTQTCTDTAGNILQFEANEGVIRSTWSATQSPVVPEPASLVLIGSGLVGLGLARRKVTSKRS